MVIFFGGEGIKISNASQTMAALHRIADSTMTRCQRLNPSMNILSRFAAAVGDCRADKWRDELLSSHNYFVLTKRSTAAGAHARRSPPSGLSPEFHAYGAVPRVVGKALARFATKHVRYFM